MGFTGPTSRCWQDRIPSGGSRGEPVSWSFPASSGPLPSLAHNPFLQQHAMFRSLWLYPWFLLSSLFWLQLSCLLLFLIRTLGITLSSHAWPGSSFELKTFHFNHIWEIPFAIWSNIVTDSGDCNRDTSGNLIISLPHRWWLHYLFCSWLALKDDFPALSVRVLPLFLEYLMWRFHWIKNSFPSLNTFQYYVANEKKEEWLDFFLKGNLWGA